MSITVDRIVGDIAVCELESSLMEEVKLENLPKGVKEGDIITKDEGGNFYIDKELREEREAYVKTLADKLVARSKKAKKIK